MLVVIGFFRGGTSRCSTLAESTRASDGRGRQLPLPGRHPGPHGGAVGAPCWNSVGVIPVQRLKALKKAGGAVNPIKYPTSLAEIVPRERYRLANSSRIW